MIQNAIDLQEMFVCADCGEGKPRIDHHYPKAKVPALCKACSKLRRQRKQHMVVRRVEGDAGARTTVMLSSRSQAVLSVLASRPDFESKSSVIETALENLLYLQPDYVKEYVSRLKMEIEASKE